MRARTSESKRASKEAGRPKEGVRQRKEQRQERRAKRETERERGRDREDESGLIREKTNAGTSKKTTVNAQEGKRAEEAGKPITPTVL